MVITEKLAGQSHNTRTLKGITLRKMILVSFKEREHYSLLNKRDGKGYVQYWDLKPFIHVLIEQMNCHLVIKTIQVEQQALESGEQGESLTAGVSDVKGLECELPG